MEGVSSVSLNKVTMPDTCYPPISFAALQYVLGSRRYLL